jgi:hypothetical protein
MGIRRFRQIPLAGAPPIDQNVEIAGPALRNCEKAGKTRADAVLSE